MLHRCKFTVFLVEWICCKEVSGGARLVFKLSEKCRPHAHESNFDETQVVDLGYEVRFVGTDSFPPWRLSSVVPKVVGRNHLALQ